MNEPQPIPPENVRIVRPDGTSIPLECVYVGRNPVCGCHRRMAVMVADIDIDDRVQFCADMIPGSTEIVFALSGRFE